MSTATQDINTVSCEAILQYLERGGRIQAVIEIRDYTLSVRWIGELLASEAAGDIELLHALKRDKKIAVFKDRKACRTPAQNAVHALRIEPVYLIKNLNKIHMP